MILQKLKESTASQHKALEGVVDVMNPEFTRGDYQELLKKFYRFYSSIEPILGKLDWNSVGYDFEHRLKTPKLERDLAALEISMDGLAGSWEELPAVETIEKGFGALYVLEGATLGGQIIKRHLKKTFGLESDKGAEFFSGYNELTGPMWKKFGTVLTAYSTEDPSRDEAIVSTAKSTFESFERCFKESSTGVSVAHEH